MLKQHDEAGEQGTMHRRLLALSQTAPPWLVSLLFHAAVMLVLGVMTFVPSVLIGPRVVIDAASGAVDSELGMAAAIEVAEADASVDLPMNDVVEDLPDLGTFPDPSAVADTDAFDLQSVDASADVASDLPSDEVLLHELSAEALGMDSTPAAKRLGVKAARAQPDRPRWAGFTPRPATPAQQGLTAAADAAAAADGLIQTLGEELDDGLTYVAWVLDASISLVEDRKTLAETLEPFVEAERPQGGKPGRLLSAVVAFGAGANMTGTYAPHGNLHKIRSLPIDESGRENVMSAVLAVVMNFQQRFGANPKLRHRLRIVVWTDESGDDTSLLEQTIAACRATGTVVHVVGPSSVLGTDRGLQPWKHPEHGVFLLPVTRGPDSFLQERLLLPYWFDEDADAGEYDGVLVAHGRKWYGGPLRERLMAGVGPYALTRLALQTGGSFRILDRPGEHQAFDLERMKAYLPDYGSGYEIVESVGASPLRMAVMSAVQRTYRTVNRSTPQCWFQGGHVRLPYYPFTSRHEYVTPQVFRDSLPVEAARAAHGIAEYAGMVEEALASFSPDVDWEYEFAKESSPRWQAWYDLTRGRLLAMSVRHQEYLAICSRLTETDGLARSTNALGLQPGTALLAEHPKFQSRTAEAIRLLQRCRDKHRGTPWELLAQWELNVPFGFSVEEHVVRPPPPPDPGPPPPPARWPRITFPSL